MASLKAFILFLTLLLCISQVQSISHEGECDHDNIEQDPEFLDIEEDMSAFQEGRALASYPNFRIHAYYDFVDQTAPSSYASYIKNDLIPPIVDYFEAALKVKSPVIGALKLSSSIGNICGRSTPSILKTGVSADFFIFYDTHAISGNNIASSRYCYLSSGTKRPLVATSLINRNGLKEAKGDLLLHEKNMYCMMHELTHTLGFSTSLYNYFMDSNGKRLSGHLKKVQINGNTRTVLDLAPLTPRLRNFYGCSTLQGAILENYGNSATAGTHFERQYFVYESMSSGNIPGERFSEFSLALLEGSGWYVPDYSYADPYSFGQGQGCSFISSTCSSTPKFDEYCSGNTRKCSPLGRGGGYCGSDSASGSCKFIRINEDYDCENPNGEDNARLPQLQVFGRGSGSRCFTGDLNTRKSSNGATTFCFKYDCVGSGSSTHVEVQVGKNKVVCTKEEKKFIDGYYGSIDCPDPLTFCSTVGKKFCPRGCMGRGNCVNNQCQCRSGYKGIDCALRA